MREFSDGGASPTAAPEYHEGFVAGATGPTDVPDYDEGARESSDGGAAPTDAPEYDEELAAGSPKTITKQYTRPGYEGEHGGLKVTMHEPSDAPDSDEGPPTPRPRVTCTNPP